MAVERHDQNALPSLLTLEEVAQVLRVSKTSVYRIVERRELLCCRVGRNLRFTREDVAAYLRARRVGSAASDQ